MSNDLTAQELVFTPELQHAIEDLMREKAVHEYGTRRAASENDETSKKTDPFAAPEFELDELDRPDFDPIDYVNRMFTTEPTPEEINEQLTRVKLSVNRLKDQVGVAVREQSKNSIRGKQELDSAKESMKELFERIGDIKKKAAASESMVTEICSDIKLLDYGKRHLTTAITSLKQLQSMASMVQRLNVALTQRQYGQAANHLSALLSLSKEFEGYDDIQRIHEIRAHIRELEANAFVQAKNEFVKFKQGENSVQMMIDVCSMVDAAGLDRRAEFISWFVKEQMDDYVKAFMPEMEASRYENVEYRYSWFHKYLNQYKDSYGKVFPSDWGVLINVTVLFCEITKKTIAQQLSTSSVVYSLKNEPRAFTKMLGVFETTFGFESMLVKTFEPEIYYRTSNASRSSDADAVGAPAEDTDASKEAPAKSKFKRSVLSAMDSIMPYYVGYEERVLKEALEHCVSDESYESGENKILPSATQLVYCFKLSVDRALKYCPENVVADVFDVLMKVLRDYVGVVVTKVSTTEKLTPKVLGTICLVVNTGEYLRARADEFVQLVQARVDSPDVRERVSADAAVADIKSSCIKGGISRLAALLCVKLGAQLSGLPARIAQPESAQVDDIAPFITEMCETLTKDCLAMLKLLESSASYKVMCDIFVKSFSDQFYATLKQCKRITEFGAQRVLMDLSFLVSTVSDLPVLGQLTDNSEQRPKANARYLKDVKVLFARSEAFLKVVISSQESIIDTFVNLFPTQDSQEFSEMLDAKGLARADKQALLDKYCQVTQQQQKPKTVLNSMIALIK